MNQPIVFSEEVWVKRHKCFSNQLHVAASDLKVSLKQVGSEFTQLRILAKKDCKLKFWITAFHDLGVGLRSWV